MSQVEVVSSVPGTFQTLSQRRYHRHISLLPDLHHVDIARLDENLAKGLHPVLSNMSLKGQEIRQVLMGAVVLLMTVL